MKTTVYLIRHGESEGNVRRAFCGWTDVPLTEKGEAQAQALASALPTPRPYHLVSSDLQRARETARLLAEGWSVSLTEDRAFREMHFGAFENRTWEGITEKYPALAERWSSDWFHSAAPEGESMAALYDRVLPAYRELLTRWKDTCWGLVAHSGVLQAILATELTGGHEAHWRFAPDNARLIRLDYGPDGFAVLKGFNL